MKQTAFIWRECVYKNNFMCKCGTPLADFGGNPQEDILFMPKENLLLCPHCGQIVAKVKEIEVEVVMSGKQGDWKDFSGEDSPFDGTEEYS